MTRLASVLLLACAITVAHAGKNPFTISDLYRIKSVEDPQISPDGKRVAFVVKADSLEAGTSNADIYIINVDGTGLHRLTTNPATDNTPRWSPDGKTILFVSTRKDGPQAWVIPADGGEPTQLTDFSTGVADPAWTRDGEHIVFDSDVYPECGADNGCNKKISDDLEKGPLQAHMAERLLYRHWTTWKDGTRTHIIAFDLAQKTYRDLTPGDFDAPAFSLGDVGFAISPDGKELCYVSNHDPNEAETTNKDLWVVPIAGGSAKNITADNKAFDGTPAYSPDGRFIAYRTQAIPAYESDCFRIALYDRASGQRTILTDAFDNWVEALAWAPDSKSIYFTADVKGHVPLYRLDLSTREIHPVVDVKTIDWFVPSANGKLLALVRRSVSDPRELWTCTTGGNDLKRLTFFNREVESTVDLRPVQEIWIPSPAGPKVQTFIVTPHDFDPSKKYPLILNVHGGPQGQWEDAFRGDWQVYPGSGYIVAFPNPHGSIGQGEAYTAEISKDWGGKVYEDVMAVADSLADIPWVDRNRMGVMGWSYGGYMMMWLEGHTDRFKAIACMMGVYDLTSMFGATEELWFPEWDLGGTPWTSDLYQKWSPSNFVKYFKTPCLVITGEQDFRVPYTQSLEFFTDLQKMGVPSRLIVFKNDGHWPNSIKSMPFYYNAHLDWFHRYLGGPPAPFDMTKMLRNEAFGKE